MTASATRGAPPPSRRPFALEKDYLTSTEKILSLAYPSPVAAAQEGKMEGTQGSLAILALLGFVVGVFIIIEFFLIGRHVAKILVHAEQQTEILVQQSSHLAAISLDLARMVAPHQDPTQPRSASIPPTPPAASPTKSDSYQPQPSRAPSPSSPLGITIKP